MTDWGNPAAVVVVPCMGGKYIAVEVSLLLTAVSHMGRDMATDMARRVGMMEESLLLVLLLLLLLLLLVLLLSSSLLLPLSLLSVKVPLLLLVLFLVVIPLM